MTISNSVVFTQNNPIYDYTNTATLTNYGTVMWAGDIMLRETFRPWRRRVIDNAGLWESVADNTMSPATRKPALTCLFINAGTLEKIGGTGTSTFNWNLINNGGTVLAVDGTSALAAASI